MGYSTTAEKFDEFLNSISEEYSIYAPVNMEGMGRFSDTDSVRYKKVKSITEIEFAKKSSFSPKEVLLPITKTLFYFTEDKVEKPKISDKKILLFLRSCDIHAIKRLDQIYLKSGFEDIYYKEVREKVKFVLMECERSFENCFCTSMNSNKTDEYNMFVRYKDGKVFAEFRDKYFEEYFKGNDTCDLKPEFVEKNDININVPEDVDESIVKSPVWKEYSSRCIACGRCNVVCGTCTCFSMQDIFYSENKNAGERRRVWSSCEVDGYTNIAGGHSFRQDKGDRMRFKVLHKISDFRRRFGYNMCVGCGRCDDVCPEYISFSNCINKLSK